METLTYNYGETPEAVIRERFESGSSRDSWAFCVQRRGGLGGDVDFDVDDLLTVLGALYGDSLVYDGPDVDIKSAAYKLRIDILAALGIDESGAA